MRAHSRRTMTLGMVSLIFGASLVAGCATLGEMAARRADLPPLMLPAVDLLQSVYVAQRLTLLREGSAPQMIDAVIEVDNGHVRLAALAQGRRIYAFNFEAGHLTEERDPVVPESLSAARILRDLEYTYWPITAVQKALPPGWIFTENGTMRELRHEGLLVATAGPIRADPWEGESSFNNLAQHYRLSIDSRRQ